MNNGVYVLIKRYEKEKNEKIVTEYEDWFFEPDNYEKIYEKLMELTNGSDELSIDAAHWCEQALIGEIYETDDWEIEIVKIY